LAVFVAVPVGPFLAQLALGIWGKATNTAVPQTLTPESWTLALIAVLFGWLTLVFSIWSGTRSNILQWQRQLARPARWTSWQRYYLDFFLLILGGLIYWQLADTGTLVAQTVNSDNLNAAGLADPILLLGPSLLLIAIALMFLRIFPYLLQLAARWSQRSSGLILPYGFTKLSRDPTAPSRVLLLISLAGGLILFATLFRHSLAVRQTQMAHYLSGADVRMGMPIATQAVDVGDLPGIEAASLVYRNVRVRLANNLGRQAELLAIEPDRFTAVSEYAPFTSRVTVDEIMPVLEATETGVIPAVFSANAHPLNKSIGDRIKYVVGTHRVEFEVRGIIGNFPSVDAPFIITNRAALEAVLDVTVLSEPWVGQKEIWLSVQPGQQTELVNQIEALLGPAGSWLLRDAQALERQMQTDLLAQEVLGAFNLNGFTLAGLSVAVFLLVHFFSAQRRLREFSLMRATGLSARQLLGLLSLEGVIMMVLGLAAGTGIGWGLAVVMRPFLSRTLTTAVGNNAIYKIVVNWTAVTGLYALLIAAYAVALILLLAILLRVGIHRAMQMGEE
jgi:putative ABC transport system permease protein